MTSPAISVVDRGHRLQHALAEVALLVAVAELHRLALAGRGAGGDRGAAQGAALEHDLHLDGGVAAAVQDLAGEDGIDGRHGVHFLKEKTRLPRAANAGSTRHSSPGETTTTPPSVTVCRRRSSTGS